MTHKEGQGKKIIGVAIDEKNMIVGGLISGEMPNKPYYIPTRRQRIRRYIVQALKITALIILLIVLVIFCLAYFGRWWQVMT